jgi:preprotein translocase subunit YajC
LGVARLYTAGHTTIDPTGNAMPISSAYAQAAGGAPAGFDLISLMPLVLIFVVFYFLLIRPQQKKMKAHRELIAALKRGDKVLTAGGIIGTVVKVEDDNTLLVEIAKDIRVRVARSTISELLDKPPAAKGPAQAQAGSGAEGTAKTGLMSQLFGKK